MTSVILIIAGAGLIACAYIAGRRSHSRFR